MQHTVCGKRVAVIVLVISVILYGGITSGPSGNPECLNKITAFHFISNTFINFLTFVHTFSRIADSEPAPHKNNDTNPMRIPLLPRLHCQKITAPLSYSLPAEGK